ncbi:lysis protein [Cronobacter sakazakii]
MTSKLSFSAIGLLALGMVIAGSLANYYHAQLTKSQASLIELNRELNEIKHANEEMVERQHKLQELDSRYTGELLSAKAEIERLRADVANGTRRLQLHANCKPMRDSSRTPSMGDGASPRLTDSAERDYFTLKERIGTITGQVNFLQQYIKEQCLR